MKQALHGIAVIINPINSTTEFILIDGVAIIGLVVNEYDCGSLTAMARAAQDSGLNGRIEKFGKEYVVCDPIPHTIWAFHKH